AELSTLRAIVFRLSSTSPAQLPQQVPAIAASLVNCRNLLSSTSASASRSGSEAALAIHKYRTFLSSLLQDRTPQGRWTGIVLIKATIEAGGWETLQKSLPWVRSLLGVLSKPDPPSSKKLCLITLTRIFVLTREYPTLVREITTPSLPAYIQACLQLTSSKPSADTLEVILESFNQLLPRHPTIFRSYLKQLHSLTGQLLAPTPSSKLSREQATQPSLVASQRISEAARRLHVQLSCCAPKGAASEEWAKRTRSTITTAHRVADKLFRAVVEDWQSTHIPPSAPTGSAIDAEVQDLQEDEIGLHTWSGVFAGSERLIGLLGVLKESLLSGTPTPVYFQVSLVLDLIARICSLTVPSTSGSSSSGVRFNNQVSKEERENLWLVLPDVHVAAMEVLLGMFGRMEQNSAALTQVILDQLVWVFNAEKSNVHIRTACYTVVAQLLERSGPGLPKSAVESITPLVRKCCEDILPVEATPAQSSAASQPKMNGNKKQQASANADAFLNTSKASMADNATCVGLARAARSLLPLLLSNIRSQNFSDAVRTRLDRAAILTCSKDAMLASVLNPPASKKFGKPAASILPLLVRSCRGDRHVESFLRPRMPVIRVSSSARDEDVDMQDEIEDDASEDGQSEDE
ncbi:hypothetical protein M011DRAFT_392501, partial [Sporormia fimetaria CBS 119925]